MITFYIPHWTSMNTNFLLMFRLLPERANELLLARLFFLISRPIYLLKTLSSSLKDANKQFSVYYWEHYTILAVPEWCINFHLIALHIILTAHFIFAKLLYFWITQSLFQYKSRFTLYKFFFKTNFLLLKLGKFKSKNHEAE